MNLKKRIESYNINYLYPILTTTIIVNRNLKKRIESASHYNADVVGLALLLESQKED